MSPLRSAAPLLLIASLQWIAGPAGADPEKCRARIITASAAFTQAKAEAFMKCRGLIVTGRLPPTTDCDTNDRTLNALARASVKFKNRVANACGGADRVCGTVDDEPLAGIDWDLGTCPGFAGAACASLPIASCADIPLCLECIGDAAVEQTVDLYFDAFVATDPSAQRELNLCQLHINRGTKLFMKARSKALARCWSRVVKGTATAPCPVPGDGAAQPAIDRAEIAKVRRICDLCGGSDDLCGGGDDLALSDIGFPGTCPFVGTCGGPVTDLGDLVDCVDCVAAFKGDCADLAAVPGLAAYPATCDPPTELNFSLPAVYGSTALTSGFVPDPFSVGITAGGPVSSNYLGGGCYGFTTSAPTFSVNYTSGGATLLRFYFIGSGDTTMLINTPSGNFVCVDDSFGTLNPTLDFNNPSSGRYDVWVATYAEGASIGGALVTTEINGNHP
jgi:hypothetical protein